MSFIEMVLIFFISIVLIYIFFRIVSFAIAKSWFEVKQNKEKGENNNGDQRKN